jgi:ParB/RepB/Spo0J family partition protein
MPTKFDGVGRADVLKFPPEALGTIVGALNLRHSLGDLTELKKSLAEHGQLQPAIVRRDAQGQPVLVAGFRRLEAVRQINEEPSAWGLQGPMAFLARLSALKEDEALVVNLRENLDRRELSPIDMAFAVRALDRLGWDRPRIAEAMRMSVSRLGQLLDLLELPGHVIDLVHTGRAPEALARQLRGLDVQQIEAYASRIDGGEKPSKVLREVKGAHREKGERRARTLSELLNELAEIGTPIALDLSQWIKGDPTVGSLADILVEAALRRKGIETRTADSTARGQEAAA